MVSFEVLKSMKTLLFSDYRQSDENLRNELTGCPLVPKPSDSVLFHLSFFIMSHWPVHGNFPPSGSKCRKIGNNEDHHRPGIYLYVCICVDWKFISNRRVF